MGKLSDVAVLMTFLLMLALALAAQLWGEDSRTLDPNHKVRWFAGIPRD